MNFKMLLAAAAVSMIAGGAVAQTAGEWRTVSPDNLLVIDTSKGRVLVGWSRARRPISSASAP